MRGNRILAGLILVLALWGGVATWMAVGRTPSTQLLTTQIQGTIREIGELATAEYAYQLCQDMTKDGLTIPLTDIVLSQSRVIYSYEGLLKAGIQFAEVEVTLERGGETPKLVITLPEAQVLSNSLDSDSLVIYDERLSSFHKLSFEDVNLSQKALKETAQEAALQKGLLERAKENARSLVSTMLLGLAGSEDWEIEFR